MKWLPLAYPLVLLLDALLFVNFLMWHNESVYEFEQRQLDLQVNYSIDAAAQQMLENGTHIDTDYIDWGSITIEPTTALETYTALLIRNLGWSDTSENRETLIESSVPLFVVAAYDGFYVYCKQQESIPHQYEDGTIINNKVFEMKWTPKLPYSETIIDGSDIKYYFYNLSNVVYGTYDVNTNTIKYDNILTLGTTNGPGSKSRSQTVIAERLTSVCNSALYTGLEGRTDVQYYIPNSFSQWSNSNPIDRPSIITYVSRNDKSIKYDIVTFGIGGAEVDDADFCLLYINEKGEKVYTYANNREDVEDRGLTVLKVVRSPKSAAMEGYYLDLHYRKE